jgi:hypothetical protein
VVAGETELAVDYLFDPAEPGYSPSTVCACAFDLLAYARTWSPTGKRSTG